MKKFYPTYYPNRTRGGYFFTVARLADGEVILESATYDTLREAQEIAGDIIKEYERQTS